VAGCGTPIDFVQLATTDDTIGIESMFICVVATGVPALPCVTKDRKTLNKLPLLFIN